jgi:hypothetical protein
MGYRQCWETFIYTWAWRKNDAMCAAYNESVGQEDAYAKNVLETAGRWWKQAETRRSFQRSGDDRI